MGALDAVLNEMTPRRRPSPQEIQRRFDELKARGSRRRQVGTGRTVRLQEDAPRRLTEAELQEVEQDIDDKIARLSGREPKERKTGQTEAEREAAQLERHAETFDRDGYEALGETSRKKAARIRSEELIEARIARLSGRVRAGGLRSRAISSAFPSIDPESRRHERRASVARKEEQIDAKIARLSGRS